jgi:hypothetical protein
VYFLKWDDQSNFRGLFSMEWYVLGNGPWDYAAINPDLARKNPVAESGAKGMFGTQYSGHPNQTHPSQLPTQRNQDDDFNQIGNWEKSATRSLFTGKIDGQRFAPMRTDYGSTYASMVFRTADMRQVMFSWIYETAAGKMNALRIGHGTVLSLRAFAVVLVWCDVCVVLPACWQHAYIFSRDLFKVRVCAPAPANEPYAHAHISRLWWLAMTSNDRRYCCDCCAHGCRLHVHVQ